MLISALFSAFITIGLVAAPFDPPLIQYSVDGQRVSGPEFMQALTPALTLLLFVLALSLGVAAGALYLETRWARHYLVVLACVFPMVGLVGTPLDWGALVTVLAGTAIFGGATYWYLFLKPNVVGYFETTRDAE